MLSVLHDDLAILDSYRFVARERLRVAMSVFCGDSDPFTPSGTIAAWAEHTTADVLLHTVPGGHLCLLDRASEIGARIARDCVASRGTSVL